MKSGLDDVRGLLVKAEHDLKTAEIGLQHAGPLDMVCFHLQQAAEKLIKAVLSHHGITYPFTHDLQELCQQAREISWALSEFDDDLAAMTPYAVRMRYDEAIYPGEEETRAALAIVRELRSLIHSLLPPEMLPRDSAR